ncbi:MAG: hypothetical protein KIT31_29580, partial [Deltaproteobacteria bacterium]|nr:hypothetical protein [Deltaproteobacteria bacterium]
VAAHPDDVGPRLILGDALVEAGDPRGDVIVLQCNAVRPDRPLRGAHRAHSDGRVKTIARLEWQRWLGDLALVLVRRRCRLRNGMLEAVTAGRGDTPAWAWKKARGHRELACVHTVRPGAWAPAELYAGFVASLPRAPRTLGIAHPDHVPALAVADRTLLLGVRTLEYAQRDLHLFLPGQPPVPAPPITPLATTFDGLARLAPAVEEIVFGEVDAKDQLCDLVGQLPARFPALQRIRIPASTIPPARLEDVRARPRVEIAT